MDNNDIGEWQKLMTMYPENVRTLKKLRNMKKRERKREGFNFGALPEFRQSVEDDITVEEDEDEAPPQQ